MLFLSCTLMWSLSSTWTAVWVSWGGCINLTSCWKAVQGPKGGWLAAWPVVAAHDRSSHLSSPHAQWNLQNPSMCSKMLHLHANHTCNASHSSPSLFVLAAYRGLGMHWTSSHLLPAYLPGVIDADAPKDCNQSSTVEIPPADPLRHGGWNVWQESTTEQCTVHLRCMQSAHWGQAAACLHFKVMDHSLYVSCFIIQSFCLTLNIFVTATIKLNIDWYDHAHDRCIVDHIHDCVMQIASAHV